MAEINANTSELYKSNWNVLLWSEWKISVIDQLGKEYSFSV